MKINIVCRWCGSDNVTRDGILRWSKEDQRWEVANELDHADCEDCAGETSLDEQPIPE